jgi:hypothetical protein
MRIEGDVQAQGGEDLSRLATALTLKLLMQGSFAADSILGEVIRLKKEVIENSLELVQLLNACGNRDVPGMGLTLCLRDKSGLGDARKLAAEYKGHILAEITLLRDEHQEMKNIRYLMLKDGEAGAVVAGLGIRYLYTDMPLLTLNHEEDKIKISARGNKLLVARGLDLSGPKAAEAVAAMVGRHTIARCPPSDGNGRSSSAW